MKQFEQAAKFIFLSGDAPQVNKYGFTKIHHKNKVWNVTAQIIENNSLFGTNIAFDIEQKSINIFKLLAKDVA